MIFLWFNGWQTEVFLIISNIKRDFHVSLNSMEHTFKKRNTAILEAIGPKDYLFSSRTELDHLKKPQLVYLKLWKWLLKKQFIS